MEKNIFEVSKLMTLRKYQNPWILRTVSCQLKNDTFMYSDASLTDAAVHFLGQSKLSSFILTLLINGLSTLM